MLTEFQKGYIIKILVVEDEPSSRMILSLTLKKSGHEVIEAENGRDAWALFQREPVPVVISDWNMPEMGGMDLCRLIRASDQTASTYIILLTGVENAEEKKKCLSAGANDYMLKPLDKNLLEESILIAQKMLS